MKARPSKTSGLIPSGYGPLLADLKARVRASQVKAAVSVNRELILLYWHIGREILRAQKAEGWGAKVVERLSKDLAEEFPEMSGFSMRNLKYMRAFAEAFSDEAIVQQAAAQIPWFHTCTLLDRVKDPVARAVVTLQIESRPHERSGKTRLVESLPKKLRGSLPTIEDIERELNEPGAKRRKRESVAK
jgi:hypothetical protein